jgi:hypothetical protein
MIWALVKAVPVVYLAFAVVSLGIAVVMGYAHDDSWQIDLLDDDFLL